MKFGLLGRVLGHSLSPQIHQALFRALGTKDTYELLEREPEEVASFVQENPEGFRGSNVTIPYKETVLPYLAAIAPEAAKIGAVNTLSFTPQGVKGYNTDYLGFDRMLQAAGISMEGAAVTVLGNGGAAKAVLQVLADRRAASIRILVRDRAKAEDALAHFLAQRPDTLLETYGSAEREGRGGQVIINTTPVGMFPKVGESPVSAAFTARFAAAVDIIYNPGETRFLADARETGARTCNGLYMLVAQAVASEEIWQQKKMDPELIPEIMKQLEATFHG
ncbi:shikimate dehydrogenase family protein [Acidaminococcus massiliensis]|uniref:shikimate dehydrogenase family protein n=1 Tax=Acidaminococcus massiliensis TaxID=1852375 RepID=UPI00266C6287|nr:shikimate dehydrogenase [Acidaminococcus massiliensis]